MSVTRSRSDSISFTGIRFERLGVNDRLADIAERGVHRMRQRVHGRRLLFTRNDEASPAMLPPDHVATAQSPFRRESCSPARSPLRDAQPTAAASCTRETFNFPARNGRR